MAPGSLFFKGVSYNPSDTWSVRSGDRAEMHACVYPGYIKHCEQPFGSALFLANVRRNGPDLHAYIR